MSNDLFSALSAPFPADAVSWRVGSLTKDKTKACALAYLDARDVMARLDAVCGPGNWQNRYPHAGAKTVCEIGIRIDGEWIWKANGAGDSDIEAEKGALSDAFKRAAVLWGVGQYLYALDSPWVALNEWKQISPDEMPKLRALLERNGKPLQSAYAAKKTNEFPRLESALRQCQSLEQLGALWKAEQSAISALPKGWQAKLTEEKDRIKALLSLPQLEAAE